MCNIFVMCSTHSATTHLVAINICTVIFEEQVEVNQIGKEQNILSRVPDMCKGTNLQEMISF